MPCRSYRPTQRPARAAGGSPGAPHGFRHRTKPPAPAAAPAPDGRSRSCAMRSGGPGSIAPRPAAPRLTARPTPLAGSPSSSKSITAAPAAGAAPQPDQPDLAGGAAPAAGAAVIDFDDEGLPASGVGLAVSLGAAGRAAIEPGPPDRIAHDRLRTAGAGAAAGAGGFVR